MTAVLPERHGLRRREADVTLANHPVVTVRPLSDPTVEAWGIDPAHPYVEACWLPIVGPAAYLLWRKLARVAARYPGGEKVDVGRLGLSLGVHAKDGGPGRHNPLGRAFSRLARFQFVLWSPGNATLLVRTHCAPASRKQLEGRCQEALAFHDRFAGRRVVPSGELRVAAP